MKIHSYGTMMIQGKLMHFEASFVVLFTTINWAMFELLSVARIYARIFSFFFVASKWPLRKKPAIVFC